MNGNTNLHLLRGCNLGCLPFSIGETERILGIGVPLAEL
jgi:hypothetical protein